MDGEKTRTYLTSFIFHDLFGRWAKAGVDVADGRESFGVSISSACLRALGERRAPLSLTPRGRRQRPFLTSTTTRKWHPSDVSFSSHVSKVERWTLMPDAEPRESPRPQPIGNMPLMTLLSICVLCGLYFVWRETYSLRRVVSHQCVSRGMCSLVESMDICDGARLKTLTRSEGRIRLSEDDGPPASEFLEDDFDEDNEVLRHDGRAKGLGSTNDVREGPTIHTPGAG